MPRCSKRCGRIALRWKAALPSFTTIARVAQPVSVSQGLGLERCSGHGWTTTRATSPRTEPLPAFVLKAAQRSDQPMLVMGKSEYILGAASTEGGNVVVVATAHAGGTERHGRHISAPLPATIGCFSACATGFAAPICFCCFLLTTLTFFASSWLALFLSKQVTRPVEALADAMDEIAAGHYGHRVTDRRERRAG